MLRGEALYEFLIYEKGCRGDRKPIILSGLTVATQKASYPGQGGGYT